jgi:hypothetical protein
MSKLAELAQKADELLKMPEQVENLQALMLQLEDTVKKQAALIVLYESQVTAMRNKLHAYCILTGDLQNAPEGCLRDRVRRLEGASELDPIDVPEDSWLRDQAGGEEKSSD